MKILIAGTPKSGNNWLKLLLGRIYRLPFEDVFLEGGEETNSIANEKWIAHSHVFPSPRVLAFLKETGALPLGIVRHPADILVSLFYHARNKLTPHPDESGMLADGDEIGNGTAQYVQKHFYTILSISRLWRDYGVPYVRYEDLVVDPILALEKLQKEFGAVARSTIELAVVSAEIGTMRKLANNPSSSFRTNGGSLFFRNGTTGDGLNLPVAIKQILSSSPFADITRSMGYELEPKILPSFDARSIDPFLGQTFFDNGVPISPELRQILLFPEIATRWSSAARDTNGDSLFDWLVAPANQDFPLITNLLHHIYLLRPDLQWAYPHLDSGDAIELALWMLRQGYREYSLAPEFIAPVVLALGNVGGRSDRYV